jgi:hypothetical protein
MKHFNALLLAFTVVAIATINLPANAGQQQGGQPNMTHQQNQGSQGLAQPKAQPTTGQGAGYQGYAQNASQPSTGQRTGYQGYAQNQRPTPSQMGTQKGNSYGAKQMGQSSQPSTTPSTSGSP